MGQVNIKTGRKKVTDTPEIKRLKDKRRDTANRYENALKKNYENKLQYKEEYFETQRELRVQIERRDRQEAHRKLNEMAKEGRTNSNLFWKCQREEEGGREKEECDVITEDGRVIEDAEEAKEHIANYFEQLYQGRKGKPAYSQ